MVAGVVVIFLFVTASFWRELLFWRSLVLVREPEQCVLCDKKYHAPALVDLATGNVGELAVYSPHPTKVGEISDVWERGTMRISPCAGLTLWSFEGDQESTLTLPKNNQTMDPAYFCRTCRALLSEVRTGWAILDLYEERRAWPAENGSEYIIRDYTVSIKDGTVRIHGHVY